MIYTLCFNFLYSQCEDGEFECHEGACVPSQWVCDGWPDCEDGSDEIDCGEMMCGDDFSCSPSGSECVPQSYVCNGWDDCTNGADETNCPPECTMVGDINEDDFIDILDVVLLANFILEEHNTVDCADINGDGNMSILDIVLLVNIILN